MFTPPVLACQKVTSRQKAGIIMACTPKTFPPGWRWQKSLIFDIMLDKMTKIKHYNVKFLVKMRKESLQPEVIYANIV